MAPVNILLDTHIWLWSVLEPKKIKRQMARELDSRNNKFWLSPVSIWEAADQHRKGRVDLNLSFEAWVQESLGRTEIQMADFTSAVAFETRSFYLPQADPLDCFIVATARTYGLTLATADQKIIASKAVPTLTND